MAAPKTNIAAMMARTAQAADAQATKTTAPATPVVEAKAVRHQPGAIHQARRKHGPNIRSGVHAKGW
jgi:hypothetical protein